MSPNPKRPGHLIKSVPFTFESADSITPTIKRSLVYWNRLDVPDMAGVLVNVASTPEMNELIAAGILSRRKAVNPPEAVWQGNDLVKILLTSHWMIFAEAERQDPGVWTLALQGNAYALPEDLSRVARTVLVELYNSLPVPGNDVPISEILRFKDKRSPEIFAFRNAMDDAYSRIISSSDPRHALNSERNNIDKSVADLFEVMGESFITKIASSVSFELSVPQLATIATTAGAAYTLGGINALAGALLYGASSLVRLRKGLGRVPTCVGMRSGAFKYVYEVVKHLVGERRPGRNAPCPCGNGKKYKKCHGA